VTLSLLFREVEMQLALQEVLLLELMLRQELLQLGQLT
jgi:hypothetical protein